MVGLDALSTLATFSPDKAFVGISLLKSAALSVVPPLIEVVPVAVILTALVTLLVVMISLVVMLAVNSLLTSVALPGSVVF